ncbi:unnamed protein product [Penicillium pancosmium]
MSVPLTKVDSAIAGLSLDDKPPVPSEKEVKKGHKRLSSQGANVWNIKDLEEQKIELELPIETQKTGCLRPESEGRNDKGRPRCHLQAIQEEGKSGLISLQFTSAASYHNANSPPQKDDELEEPFLKGFEWDKEECWTRLIVHQSNTGPPKESGSKKSKKKNKEA